MSSLRACFCPCFGDRAAAALPEEARGGRGHHSGHRWRRSGRFLSQLMRRGRRHRRDRDQEHGWQDILIYETGPHSDWEYSTQESTWTPRYEQIGLLEEESTQQFPFIVQEPEPHLAPASTNQTGTVISRLVPVIMFLCLFFLLCIFANVHQNVQVQDSSLIFGSIRLDVLSSSRGQVAVADSWVFALWCVVVLFLVGVVFVVYSILFGAILVIWYIMHKFEHRDELRLPRWFRRFIGSR